MYDACGLYAVHARHADIHQYDIRMNIAYQVNRGFAVGCFADYLDIGQSPEQAPQSLTHHGMIVNQHHTNSLFRTRRLFRSFPVMRLGPALDLLRGRFRGGGREGRKDLYPGPLLRSRVNRHFSTQHAEAFIDVEESEPSCSAAGIPQLRSVEPGTLVLHYNPDMVFVLGHFHARRSYSRMLDDIEEKFPDGEKEEDRHVELERTKVFGCLEIYIKIARGSSCGHHCNAGIRPLWYRIGGLNSAVRERVVLMASSIILTTSEARTRIFISFNRFEAVFCSNQDLLQPVVQNLRQTAAFRLFRAGQFGRQFPQPLGSLLQGFFRRFSEDDLVLQGCDRMRQLFRALLTRASIPPWPFAAALHSASAQSYHTASR